MDFEFPQGAEWERVDLSEKYRELLTRLVRLDGLWKRYQMGYLRRGGQGVNPHRGQGRVLSILRMQPEISQKQLGYLLDMRNQSLGELLTKLERAGYIERTPSEDDKRTSNIKLTPEGMAAADAQGEAQDAEAEPFMYLSDEERATLCGYLDRIIARLEQLTGGEGEREGFGMDDWFRRCHDGRGEFDPRDARRYEHLLGHCDRRGFGGRPGGFGGCDPHEAACDPVPCDGDQPNEE